LTREVAASAAPLAVLRGRRFTAGAASLRGPDADPTPLEPFASDSSEFVMVGPFLIQEVYHRGRAVKPRVAGRDESCAARSAVAGRMPHSVAEEQGAGIVAQVAELRRPARNAARRPPARDLLPAERRPARVQPASLARKGQKPRRQGEVESCYAPRPVGRGRPRRGRPAVSVHKMNRPPAARLTSLRLGQRAVQHRA
jgi:hypothetical protein